MAMDNQLLVGTILFLGIAYFALAQKEKPPRDAKTEKRAADASSILQEYDDLKARLSEFETNDAKKGRDSELYPLSESDQAGLIEVITRLNQLDKRQAKTQALGREEARRLHSDVAALDQKARRYLERFDLNKQQKEAWSRGRVSHTRSLSRQTGHRSGSGGFVADAPTLESGGNAPKKRKPNFNQNTKPVSVFEGPKASDNRSQSERSRSAFETNEARDDTNTHADRDADMVENEQSGAHEKSALHIRPLDRQVTTPARTNNVTFNQSPGPVDDSRDQVTQTGGSADIGGKQVQHPQMTAEQLKEWGEGGKYTFGALVSPRQISEIKFQLGTTMEELDFGTKRLTPALDEELRTLIATAYGDDPEGGDELITRLRQYRHREEGMRQSITTPNDPVPRRKKRDINQVVTQLEKSKETALQVKRVKSVPLPAMWVKTPSSAHGAVPRPPTDPHGN